MKHIAPAIFAASCALAACSTSPAAIPKSGLVPGWPDTGTPPATIAARDVRLYRDEKGVLWDDTGRRHEAAQ